MLLQRGTVLPIFICLAMILIPGCKKEESELDRNNSRENRVTQAPDSSKPDSLPKEASKIPDSESKEREDTDSDDFINVAPIIQMNHEDEASEPLPEEAIEIADDSVKVNGIIGVGGGAGKSFGKKYRKRRSRIRSNPPPSHGGTHLTNDKNYDLQFFKAYGVNPMVDTDDDRFSTFAVDVDTASYTICRKMLDDGNLPNREAVRVEELVNYFDYGYDAPDGDTFAAYFEGGPSPFAANRKLISIGIKGKEISTTERKDATLTFVIDVSGSMGREGRLELVKKSLILLVERLRPSDRIGIAVYGSQGRRLLKHTLMSEGESEIKNTISGLFPEGSTNAEQGMKIGYTMAGESYDPARINRVILCSDGVANVGKTGPDSILEVIKKEVKRGICLTTVGFGMNNYNDVLMEQLGNKGNGHYAYVDTLKEAQRIFGSGLVGTLQVIARDVKIQVEFNPERIRSYRLIGYENRKVRDRDFRNDRIDAGEIGAGHSVTALYEIKYWKREKSDGPLGWCRIRYKSPDNSEETAEIETQLLDGRVAESLETATSHFRLASCVVQFAEILRKSYWADEVPLTHAIHESTALAAMNPDNERLRELSRLITCADNLLNAREDSLNTKEDSRRVSLQQVQGK